MNFTLSKSDINIINKVSKLLCNSEHTVCHFFNDKIYFNSLLPLNNYFIYKFKNNNLNFKIKLKYLLDLLKISSKNDTIEISLSSNRVNLIVSSKNKQLKTTNFNFLLQNDIDSLNLIETDLVTQPIYSDVLSFNTVPPLSKFHKPNMESALLSSIYGIFVENNYSVSTNQSSIFKIVNHNQLQLTHKYFVPIQLFDIFTSDLFSSNVTLHYLGNSKLLIVNNNLDTISLIIDQSIMTNVNILNKIDNILGLYEPEEKLETFLLTVEDILDNLSKEYLNVISSTFIEILFTQDTIIFKGDSSNKDYSFESKIEKQTIPFNYVNKSFKISIKELSKILTIMEDYKTIDIGFNDTILKVVFDKNCCLVTIN